MDSQRKIHKFNNGEAVEAGDGKPRIENNQAATQLEAAMLDMPQYEPETEHIFGPGVYIRQVSIKAGATFVGHHHKTEHLTIVLKGRIAFATEDGPIIVEGPATFLSQPGRKAVHALTDCVVQNILATTETDIEKIEDQFIEKSEAWIAANDAAKLAQKEEGI